MTELERRLHQIRINHRERWAGDGEAFMDALRAAAAIGAEIARKEEREAIDDMLCAEAMGLAGNAYLAGMSGDKENADRGEIASTALNMVIDMVRARGELGS